jgi:23S rRNA pseudouridine2605 synthase
VLANAGVASRRAAEALIAEGRVILNGEVVREMGKRAMPGDTLQVDGRQIRVPDAATAEKEHVYIALNKPDGVVSTARDPHGRPTVIGLVASGAKG